jgi:hypothetical protein
VVGRAGHVVIGSMEHFGDQTPHVTTPGGILASALLRCDGNRWQITTLWRDRAALDAMSALMRARPELPAASRVFREVGAEPTPAVFDVINGLQRPAAS